MKDYKEKFWKSKMKGLEKLIEFEDVEYKRNFIPNSTVWVFNKENHEYKPEIFADDIGCGMTAMFIEKIDEKKAADKIYEHLKGKKILGRGNHFVDICSEIDMSYNTNNNINGPTDPYNLLILHTHGKSYDLEMPSNITEAKIRQKDAEEFRKTLLTDLADLIGSQSNELFGNWTHNTIEEGDKVIYRKGVIKTEPYKVNILPAHLGSNILFYTTDKEKIPPYSSMPHATGRSGPRGKTKVSPEKAAEIRKTVYIPEKISNSSLRSEHPSCYNNFDKIYDTLIDYIIPLGESKIKSYVGKV